MEAEPAEKVQEDPCQQQRLLSRNPGHSTRSPGASQQVALGREAPDGTRLLSVCLAGMSTSSWAQEGHVAKSLPEGSERNRM